MLRLIDGGEVRKVVDWDWCCWMDCAVAYRR